jgi:hypothetical protein
MDSVDRGSTSPKLHHMTLRHRGLESYVNLTKDMPAEWSKPKMLGRNPYGPGAVPRPVPALADCGTWQDLGKRWAEAWDWLYQRQWTHDQQAHRMMAIRDLCREFGEHPYDPQDQKRLDDLMVASCIPFADSDANEMWACDSEAGLVFVFATPEGIAQRCSASRPTALYGWPGVLLTPIAVAHSIPHDQIHPWGIAMEALGYLYW